MNRLQVNRSESDTLRLFLSSNIIYCVKLTECVDPECVGPSEQSLCGVQGDQLTARTQTKHANGHNLRSQENTEIIYSAQTVKPVYCSGFCLIVHLQAASARH